LRLVAVGLEALLALGAAVGLGDGHDRPGVVAVHLLPADLLEGVGAAGVELVLVAQRGLVGERRKAVVGPLLPARADHRLAKAVGAVDAALLALALGAAARVPVGGVAVAVQVFDPAALVVRLGAEYDAVAGVRLQEAVVGVVGGADPGEGAVYAVLVAVDLL